jgi:uncharacterized protein (DUF2164 family)
MKKNKQDQIKELKDQIANIQRKVQSYSDQIKVLQNRLAILEKPIDIKISDHAIARYLERVAETDLKKIQKEILTPDMVSLINKFDGTGRFQHNLGFWLAVENGNVKTIMFKNDKDVQ